MEEKDMDAFRNMQSEYKDMKEKGLLETDASAFQQLKGVRTFIDFIHETLSS